MRRRRAVLLALVTAATALVGPAGTAGGSALAAPAGAEDCHEGSAARVSDTATAAEPELYPKNEANAYGVIKDSPRLANGSVKIPRSSTWSPTTP